MKLYFCDLCNESVPHSDLEVGKAFIRKSRVVCASCDEAMSVALASQGTPAAGSSAAAGPATQTAAAAEHGAARHAAEHALPGVLGRPAMPPKRSSAGVGTAGLWVAVIALFLSAGTLMYLLDELSATETRMGKQRREGLDELHETFRLSELASEVRDNELVAALQSTEARIGDKETDLSGMVQGLEQRLADAHAASEALRADLVKLEGDVGRRIGLQDGQLEEFDADLERYDQEIRFFGERLNELEVRVLTEEFIAGAGKAKPSVEPTQGAAWSSILPDLASTESGDRWAAVQALGETKDLAVVEHLIPVLKDSDIFVRMATARVLGDLGAKAAVPYLIDALEDTEVAVQEAAVGSLRSITGRNFGFEIEATERERAKRIKAWRAWWEKSGDKASDKPEPAGE